MNVRDLLPFDVLGIRMIFLYKDGRGKGSIQADKSLEIDKQRERVSAQVPFLLDPKFARRASLSTEIAQLLLDIDAVHYNATEPYRFTSGTVSPVYVDCRRLISYPSARKCMIQSALDRIQALSTPKPEVIAGGETAGIPYAAIIADRLGLPMIYIRKKPKEFGTKSRIEGKLDKGQTVLLVEDLIFDAQSKLSFAEAIREAGGVIADTLVVFEYGRESARAQLTAVGLNLISLTSWAYLLDLTVAQGAFTAQQADVVRRFLADPNSWMAGEYMNK